MARGYLALHIPQHQLLVPDVQDDVLSPDFALGVQQLEPCQTVLGAAQVPLQPQCQQVLGGHGAGVTGSPAAMLGKLGPLW